MIIAAVFNDVIHSCYFFRLLYFIHILLAKNIKNLAGDVNLYKKVFSFAFLQSSKVKEITLEK